MIAFHELDLVLEFHREQLELYGGGKGIRDQGMVESAVMRPHHKAAYGEPDIYELAAAYLFGIVQNHPFVDGNKRTGFVAADVFLALHGISVEAEQAEVVALVLGVADGRIIEDGIAAFLRDHSAPIET